MILPPYLKQGDCIALTATARSITREQIAPAVKFMENKGLKVLVDDELFRVDNQFGGTDTQRADFFNKMLSKPEVKALWNVRGGYGTGRMIDGIDFNLLFKHPKWLIGFSDYTVIHCHVQKQCNMATIHGTMPIFMWEKTGTDLQDVESAMESLYLTLIGCAPDHKVTGPIYNEADFEGEIIGGNLSVLLSVMGTASEPDLDGKILFIEDLDEYLYHIDRLFQTMHRSGKLSKLIAILVGSFIQIHDHQVPFGYTVEDIVLHHCKKYGYPIVFGVNSGHHLQNMAIPFGVNAKFQNGLLTFARS